MGYLNRLILKMILVTYKSDAHPAELPAGWAAALPKSQPSAQLAIRWPISLILATETKALHRCLIFLPCL
jgi:hypothetical protein